MFATLPGPHAIAAVLITVIALILFSRERIPLQASCLGILIILMLGFGIFPLQYGGRTIRADFFLAGFANEALIAICALLILARGVGVSGALGPLGSLLVRLWVANRSAGLFVTLVLSAILSAFVNNTPIVVILLPVLVGVAHKIGAPPSKILSRWDSRPSWVA